MSHDDAAPSADAKRASFVGERQSIFSPAPPVPGAWGLSPALDGRSASALGAPIAAAHEGPRPASAAGVYTDKEASRAASIEAWNALTQRAAQNAPLDSLSPHTDRGSVGSPFSPASTYWTTRSALESDRGSDGFNTPQTVQSALWRFVPTADIIPEESVRSGSSDRETHRVVHHEGFVLPPMKLRDFAQHLERSESQRSRSSAGGSASSWLQRRRERQESVSSARDKGETVRSPLAQSSEVADEPKTTTRVEPTVHSPLPPALSVLGAPVKEGEAVERPVLAPPEDLAETTPYEPVHEAPKKETIGTRTERSDAPAPALPSWSVAAPAPVTSPSLSDRMTELGGLGFEVQRKDAEAPANASIPPELREVRALNIQKPQTAEVGSSWSDACKTPANPSDTPAPTQRADLRNFSGGSFLVSPSTAESRGWASPPPPLLYPNEALYMGEPAPQPAPLPDGAKPGRRKASEMLDELLRQTEEEYAPAAALPGASTAMPWMQQNSQEVESKGEAPRAEPTSAAPAAAPAPVRAPAPTVVDETDEASLATPHVDRTQPAPPIPAYLDTAHEGDASQLSMLGSVVGKQTPFNFDTYFDSSLQRIHTEVSSNPTLPTAPGAAGRIPAPESDPTDLFRNAPLRALHASASPIENLHEFTYIMDDGAPLLTPYTGARPQKPVPDATWVPSLPPLDTFLPEEREIVGVPPIVQPAKHVAGLFDDWDMDAPQTTALPLEFVTRPNSILSRGRPVKKTEEGTGSIFYASLPEKRHKTFPQPMPVPADTTQPIKTWNFEDDDEELEPEPEPTPAPRAPAPEPAAAPRPMPEPAAASHPMPEPPQPTFATPPKPKRKAKKDVHTKYMPDEPNVQTKRGTWWRRKGQTPTKAAAAPPESPRASTSTSNTTKFARRTGPPGFEPSQPGKYYLAGTVSLPTLNIARTPEQRARNETGLPETEPALIQSLLAAPSSSTVRARAGIIKTLPFSEEVVPPLGQVLVAEERKILVRPVM